MTFQVFRMAGYNFIFALLITLIYFLILIGYKEILSVAFLFTFMVMLGITILLDLLPIGVFMGVFQSIFTSLVSIIPIAGGILAMLSEIIVNFLFGIIIFLSINWVLTLLISQISMKLIIFSIPE